MSGIRLAMEIPALLQAALEPEMDLSFALAPTVLADSAYARALHDRPADRELILDNGMHELGRPLAVEDLREAAIRCRADIIIAPDDLDDAAFTASQYEHMKDELGSEDVRIALNLCGQTYEAREQLLEGIGRGNIDVLCLPYRRPRFLWFWEHCIWHFERVHLLGLQGLDELRLWRNLAACLDWDSNLTLSLDTSKPVKWGLQHKLLRDLSSWRGSPLSSIELMRIAECSPQQWDHVSQNVSFLKAALK